MTQAYSNSMKNPIELAENIKGYIRENDCPELTVDVSHLNLFDAGKVTVLCSTYHWAKYPQGKIQWKISSDDLGNLINPLNLGNINFVTA